MKDGNESDEVPTKKFRNEFINNDDSEANKSDERNCPCDDKLLNKHSIKRNVTMNLDESLMCNICQDIMYCCVSIQPCLHSFCASCLLRWRCKGDGCPTCRADIIAVSKNHLIQNIIDKYLITHPEKDRSQEEKDEADQDVENNKMRLFASSFSGSSSSVLSSTIATINSCSFCGYPSGNASSAIQTNSNIPHCTQSTVHIQCQCCYIFIPDLSALPNVPSQKCKKCNGIFCSLLLGSCSNCTTGCLHMFKDFVSNPILNQFTSQVPQFLPENFFETNVLRNYLNGHNMSVQEMYSECLRRLSCNEMIVPQSINDSSSLCIQCSKETLLNIVYEFFVSIPKSDFPPEIAARPDCYYGRNCRTQRTRPHHAANYGHACPQTRF